MFYWDLNLQPAVKQIFNHCVIIERMCDLRPLTCCCPRARSRSSSPSGRVASARICSVSLSHCERSFMSQWNCLHSSTALSKHLHTHTRQHKMKHDDILTSLNFIPSIKQSGSVCSFRLVSLILKREMYWYSISASEIHFSESTDTHGWPS